MPGVPEAGEGPGPPGDPLVNERIITLAVAPHQPPHPKDFRWYDGPERTHTMQQHTQGTTPTTGTQARLNVNMNAQTADALRQLARDNGISFTEAVRRAISIYKFFEDEMAQGRKIQTMDRDGGNKRDVVLM